MSSRTLWRLALLLAALPLRAEVIVSTLPSGMVQAVGQATATDSFSITNTGASAVDLTLVKDADFFSLDRERFTIGSGSTEIVNIAARAQPASGLKQGNVLVRGNAIADVPVSVKLLVVNPPPAPVTATTPSDRVQVESPGGAIISPPVGGPPAPFFDKVTFSNSGAATLDALVVSDVPWIEPFMPTVSIAPGGTVDVPIRIDLGKRPDADTLLGSARGKVSLLFFSAPLRAATQTGGAPPNVSKTSVVVVNVNVPFTTAGTPPPLLPNEVALFLGGFRAGDVDFFLSSRSSQPFLNDLRLYFASGASAIPSIVANIDRLKTNQTFAFKSAVPRPGAIQLRTSEIGSLALASERVSGTATGSYGAALPILRSDRAISSGQRLFLPGVTKDGAASIDLFLQEVSGNEAVVRIEYVTAVGGVLATTTESIRPFGSLTLTDAVPDRVVTAVVSNLSNGPARVAAFALLVDSNTGDSWAITDSRLASSNPAEPVVVPIFAPPAGARTAIYIFNPRPETVTLTFQYIRPRGRPRLVQPTPGASSLSTFILGAEQTLTLAVENEEKGGYVAIASSGGELSASARSVVMESRGGYGAAWPVVPRNATLAAGQSKRFVGIEDSETATVSARTPLTYRSDLMLAEVSGGGDVSVRLTLRYTFSSGKVSALAMAMKDVTVPAGRFLFVRELARSIIGPQRESFGDLHNMELDVEAVGGSGRIVSVVQATENASGDPLVRD